MSKFLYHIFIGLTVRTFKFAQKMQICQLYDCKRKNSQTRDQYSQHMLQFSTLKVKNMQIEIIFFNLVYLARRQSTDYSRNSKQIITVILNRLLL